MFEPAGPNATPDPAQYGPYPVGVKTVALYDPTRSRNLLTEIWYPAREAARGGSHTHYRPEDALPESIVAGLGEVRLSTLETYAVRDAEEREDGAPFPVILFSHGSGGVRFQSTHLTAALASHGYVVLAPDHEGNTLRDLLNAMDLVPTDFLESYADRPQDLIFLLDWLERGEDPKLRAISDLDRAGAVGHSFGSVTAVRTAGLDSRIDVAVAQAPTGYLTTWLDVGRDIKSLGIPIMLHVAGLDRTLPPADHADRLFVELAAPRYRVLYPTAGHFTFSDLCGLDLAAVAPSDEIGVGDVLDDGCGPDNIAPLDAFPLIRRTAIALLNAALRGSDQSLAHIVTVEGEIEVTADP